jgi:hypothetical protein
VIPLNQLIPECLLALGGAFLLGNLAAYIRLRPAWRDAKHVGSGQPSGDKAAKRGAKGTGKPGRTGSATTTSSATGSSATGSSATRSSPTGSGATGADSTKREHGGSGGTKAAARPKPAASSRVSARVREPTGAGTRLPSRTRVLANVLIGLLITAAALATLIRG